MMSRATTFALLMAGTLSSAPSLAEPGATRPDVQMVYVICETALALRPVGPCKIGISNRPIRRLARFQTAHARPIVLVATFSARNASAVETAAHHRLRHVRMTGEWFGVSPALAIEVVADEIARESPL